MTIFGILNITEDSFSDGGKFLDPDAALAQADELVASGADVIDIGAASSNPDAKPVAAEVEIARLERVVSRLSAQSIPLSIDTFAPQVQRWALAQGVDYLNDIHGFADDTLYPALAASGAKLIVMHAVQAQGRATRVDVPPAEIFDRVRRASSRRASRRLPPAGIARERLILDPGMGFFLGTDPQTSLPRCCAAWATSRNCSSVCRFWCRSRAQVLHPHPGGAHRRGRPVPPPWRRRFSPWPRARTISGPMRRVRSRTHLPSGQRWTVSNDFPL